MASGSGLECCRSLAVVLASGALAACTWGPSAPRSGAIAADPPAVPGAFAPNLSPGPLLSWLERGEEGVHRLVFSRLGAGGWLPPEEVARSPGMFANWADVPAVVGPAPTEAGASGAPGGELRAHWLETLGEGTYAYGIRWKTRVRDQSQWQDRGWLHEDDLTEAEHGFVSWTVGEAGSWVFWLDGRAHPQRGETTLRGGRVGADAIDDGVLDPRVCDCCPTDSALAASGPVVVYRDRSADEVRDIASVRWTGTAWTPPATVFEDGWRIAGCPVNGPAVDARGDRVAVAWYTAPEGVEMVRVAFSEDGGRSFGPPILVDGERPLGRVDVALLEQGGAVVSWLARPADDGASPGSAKAALSIRRVSPRGRAGAPLVVASTSEARASGVPRILIHQGELLIAWVDPQEPRLRSSRLPLGHLPRLPR